MVEKLWILSEKFCFKLIQIRAAQIRTRNDLFRIWLRNRQKVPDPTGSDSGSGSATLKCIRYLNVMVFGQCLTVWECPCCMVALVFSTVLIKCYSPFCLKTSHFKVLPCSLGSNPCSSFPLHLLLLTHVSHAVSGVCWSCSWCVLQVFCIIKYFLIFGSSVVDPECSFWILIFNPSRIPDPGSRNSNKREGRKKFVVILFFVATNFT